MLSFLKKRKEPIRLKEYRFHFGGDMRGSENIKLIRRKEDGRLYIGTIEKDWHDQAARVAEYDAAADYMDRIEAIYQTYDIPSFVKFPKEKYMNLDGGTAQYTFEQADEKCVRFSDHQAISPKGAEALHKIHAIIVEAMRQAERLPGLELELDETCAEGCSHITENVLEMSVVQYSQERLYFYVKNGRKEAYDWKAEIRLYKGEQLVPTRAMRYEKKVPSMYCEHCYVHVEERLSAGTYTLQAGELSATFYIK